MNVRPEIDDDRRQELEAFAQGGERVGSHLAPTIAPMVSPADRVFGAQKVAVYRDETRILQRLAALGAAAGDDWFYRYPVKNRKENRTDWIEGASIKLANDVARIYGNCDVDTRVFDLGDTWLIYARFTDFESGFSMTRPFQQRKTGGKIGGDGGDADARRLDMAFQIGVSKAIRNVVVNALQTYADFAFDNARNSLVQKIGTDLEGWRKRTVDALGRISVELTRAERLIGKPVNEWLAPDVARIIAMGKAVTDGMASADESFPPLDAKPEGEATDDKPQNLDGFANKNAEATTTTTATTQSASPQDQGQTPAAANPASAQHSPSSDAGAGKAEAAKQDGKPAEQANDKLPTNEKKWVVFATAAVTSATDADVLTKWWKDGKNLRNKCNVSEDVREGCKTALDEKVTALRAAAAK